MIKSPYDKFMEEYVAISVPAKNKKGFKVKYVYYATWYLWYCPERQLKKEKQYVLGKGTGCLFAFVLTILLRSGLNALALVAFPAIVAMMALFVMLFGIGQFYCAHYRTTRSTFTSVNRRLRLYPVINGLGNMLAFAGCIYYMTLYGWIKNGIVLSICYLIGAFFGFSVYRQYTKIPVSTEINDTLKHVDPIRTT